MSRLIYYWIWFNKLGHATVFKYIFDLSVVQKRSHVEEIKIKQNLG